MSDWNALRECLSKQDGSFSLFDAGGRPVELFRYRHDSRILESNTMVADERQMHISSPVLFNRKAKDIVVRIERNGQVVSIPIAKAKIERHGEYDVLQIGE